MDKGPLDRLEGNAAALNAESDKFRDTFEAVEAAVNRMAMGVEVEIQEGWGYGKMGQRHWGFYKLQDNQRTPVMGVRRADRVGFTAVLGTLLDRLAEVSGSEMSKLKQANEAMEAQLKRLTGKSGGKG